MVTTMNGPRASAVAGAVEVSGVARTDRVDGEPQIEVSLETIPENPGLNRVETVKPSVKGVDG